MRPISTAVLLACLAAGLALAGPAAARNPQPLLGGPAPEAADQTFGTAIMSGLISSAGETVSGWGGGVVSSERVSAGNYDVVFARPIGGCPASATTAAVGRIASVTGLVSNNHGYRVITFNTSGTAVDATFYLTVTCAR